jgi:hypothetical protein
MHRRNLRTWRTAPGVTLLLFLAVGCAPEYRPWWLGGVSGTTEVAGSVFAAGQGQAFSEVLIQDRTFVKGQVVTTVTYRADDMARHPLLIDFNRDGKVDPVVGYQQDSKGVIQILLSYGEPGTVQYTSLTLDGGENPWKNLADVAIADIDGDGNLDIVAATQDGVVYMHHPSDPARTHVLSEWGQSQGALELIAGTTEVITDEELTALLAQALGPGANLDNYIVTVEQGYTNVEIADFDNNGDNDIAASRRLRVSLEPKPDLALQPIEITAGSLQVLLNPGRATTGENWTAVPVGSHERHTTLDREGARDLRSYDIDGDGDLDLISTAADDQNVQVAWFENPGGPGGLDPGTPWIQHRIGSVRGAYTFDVADVTGDGRADVIATSPTQMQMVLFVQPESVADRGYDWYTTPIVNFENYEPRVVNAVDVDNDGALELVVGGTNGAVRYFKPTTSPIDEWQGHVVVDFNPPGDVGLMGYGDLDGDGDADLVAVVAGQDANADRVSWIRNELIP